MNSTFFSFEPFGSGSARNSATLAAANSRDVAACPAAAAAAGRCLLGRERAALGDHGRCLVPGVLQEGYGAITRIGERGACLSRASLIAGPTWSRAASKAASSWGMTVSATDST